MNRWNRTPALACLGLLLICVAPAHADDALVQSNTKRTISIDDVPAPSPQAKPSPKPSSEPKDTPKPAHEAEPLPARELLPLGPVGQPLTNNTQRTDHSTGSYWLQTITALGIVIALIFALRWVIRRLGGPAASIGGGGLVEVLARTPIGHKTTVMFLRINQRIIVAAQSPAGINTLAEFDEPNDVADVLQHVSANQPQSISRGFAKLLGQHTRDDEALAHEAGGDDDEHLVDRTRSGMSSLISKIRSMKGGDPP